MSFPFDRLSFTQSSRMTSAVVGLSLIAVGTAIYLSPQANHGKSAAAGPLAGQQVIPPRSAPLAATTGGHTKKPTVKPKSVKPPAFKVIHAPGRTDVVVVKTSARPPSQVLTTTVHATIAHCSQFHWQQDAQAAYLANLSDPGGMDGAVGPHNGDGIACNQLAVDPNRPASVPVDAYTPPAPTPATKAALVAPSSKYFGIAQDGLPGDSGMFDRVAAAAGKAPSAVEWFAGFDADYPAQQVTTAWSRGALPVLSWMSVAADSSSGHDSSEYTLTHIVNGDVDAYLYKFAGDVVRTNLPVAIRFDHEMNNNTYPWSAGLYNNTPAKYVAAWQHIWNIFQKVGANNNAIWLWSPTRIDNLKPHATSGGGVGQTDLAEDFPGDQYVDWLGASIYLRVANTGPGYDATFGKTMTALKALSSKPIFISETAAVQSDLVTRQDLTQLKASWTTNALAAFQADPRIVGFVWFNNQGTQVVGGQEVTNDWRFDSSPAALTAFKQGIADPRFASGTLPDHL